jgi:K+-sensing histidine kinase KdpD
MKAEDVPPLIRHFARLSENAVAWKRALFNLSVTAAILVITIALTELLRIADIGDTSIVVVYCLAVIVISCLTPNYSYGIFAAMALAFACDYFITEPRLGFSFTKGSPVTLVTMLGATLLTSTLTIQIRIQTRLARERGQRWQMIYEITERLLAARSTDAIIDLSNDSLRAHLSPRSVIYYPGDPVKDSRAPARRPRDQQPDEAFSAPDEQKRVHRIFQRGRAENYSKPDDAPCSIFYFPVVSKGCILGVFGVNCRERPLSRSELSYVQILTGQVSLAIEMQNLSDAQSRILLESEREKTRSTLLRSISHDLRTPLTTIIGAGTAVLEQPGMEKPERDGLMRDIVDNAEWLVRMVENILTITKLTDETIAVKKTPEAAEEVVAQAVAIARRRFPNNLIHARAPDKLLMVPMDATLIAQVLINLMENAAKNSPDQGLILVDLQKQGSYARFEISDEGGGIPEDMVGRLFEPYARRAGAAGAPGAAGTSGAGAAGTGIAGAAGAGALGTGVAEAAGAGAAGTGIAGAAGAGVAEAAGVGVPGAAGAGAPEARVAEAAPETAGVPAWAGAIVAAPAGAAAAGAVVTGSGATGAPAAGAAMAGVAGASVAPARAAAPQQQPQQPAADIDKTRGAGLGLSICHTIVHAHGGRIDASNREEGGAKFVVLLPLDDAAPASAAKPA